MKFFFLIENLCFLFGIGLLKQETHFKWGQKKNGNSKKYFQNIGEIWEKIKNFLRAVGEIFGDTVKKF